MTEYFLKHLTGAGRYYIIFLSNDSWSPTVSVGVKSLKGSPPRKKFTSF